MKPQDIHLRDPFVLPRDGIYYLYGSRGPEAWDLCYGLDVYESRDLAEWSAPREVFTPPAGFWADRNFWAPEVHEYRGRFYLFVSLKSADRCRAVQIFSADTPRGPFLPHSDGPVTPSDWECLDGTPYFSPDGTPYLIFCHEWLQVTNGEMCALPLTDDLRRAAGAPFLLFRAAEPDWAMRDADHHVTDGPFVYHTPGGRFLMLWSSFTEQGYCEAVSYPEHGRLTDRWIHDPRLLFEKDGGHGMVFRAFDGSLRFTYHQPNDSPRERPHFVTLTERDDTLYAPVD